MPGEGGTNGGRGAGFREVTPWIAIGLTFALAALSWVQQWSVSSERLASGLTLLHGLQEQGSDHEARLTLLEERFRVMGQRDDAQDRRSDQLGARMASQIEALAKRIEEMDGRQRTLESERVLALDRLGRLEQKVYGSQSPDRAPPPRPGGFGHPN